MKKYIILSLMSFLISLNISGQQIINQDFGVIDAPIFKQIYPVYAYENADINIRFTAKHDCDIEISLEFNPFCPEGGTSPGIIEESMQLVNEQTNEIVIAVNEGDRTIVVMRYQNLKAGYYCFKAQLETTCKPFLDFPVNLSASNLDYSTEIEITEPVEPEYGEDPSENNSDYFSGVYNRQYTDPAKPNLSNQNYIYKRLYLTEDKTGYSDQVQYYDGLGRPNQGVQVKVSPQQKDLVSLQEYDEFGRQSIGWLPAAMANNNGAFASTSAIMAASRTTNTNNGTADQNPSSKTIYENSALNRVLEQYGPGQDWHTNKKSLKTGFITNKYKAGTSITFADSLVCAKYKTADNLSLISISRTDNYAANDLYVTRTKDEDGNIIYEFKNKIGQVVLSRQINESTLINTYYVYDSYGNLRVVIPPEAADRLLSSNGWTESDNTLKQYAYLYKYDSRNRCIAKKLPGCEWIYYVYDKANRPVFIQDGEQRLKNEWLFTKYDEMGRVIVTGEVVLNKTHQELQDILKTKVVQESFSFNSKWSYTWASLQGLVDSDNYKRVLSVNYYDNYKFRKRDDLGQDYFTYEGSQQGYNTRYGIDESQYKHKGLLTGSVTAILDGSGEDAFLYSVMYYDDHKRLIQSHSTSHLAGGIEKEYIAYNFTGQPTRKKHIHTATGKTTQTEDYAYSYDHAGRLLKTTHKLNSGTEVILAENTYDELGRLKEKKSNNNNDALKTTYTYNVRSWLKTIGGRFTEQLYYNEALNSPDGSFTNKKSYTGNISAKHSGHWDSADRYYFFTYDNLSRLLSADYSENSRQTGSTVLSSGRYSNSYSYDKQGNILTLERGGIKWQGAYGIIDDLTYEYTGNQLKRITDTGEKTQRIESEDFKDYADLPVEYVFNANGAMSKDLNKGISDIQYNSLNLPRQMDIKSPFAEARNEYLYSASGVKLRVTHKWNSNYSKTPLIGSTVNTAALDMTKVTDYIGNKVYEQGVLKKILVDGGYIEDGKYYFTLQDHLGNTRMVLSQEGSIVQREYYYPFGMTVPHIEYDGKYPYRYNGKELDQMHRLDLYDYSARYYDQAIGRFTTVDPLAEKYYSISPYAYCGNNPIKFIDPTGMKEDDIVITGANNSSLTLKTDAVDLKIKSDIDFGGNHQVDASNVAIGYESYVQGTAASPVFGGYVSVPIQNVLFLGGKYSGHWYKYIGIEGGIAITTGADVSGASGKNWFIGFNSQTNKNDPMGFAGAYVPLNASLSFKALAGLSISGSVASSIDGSWTVFSLGGSASLGFSLGMFDGFGLTVNGGLGYLQLLTPAIETNQRSFRNSAINWGAFFLDQIPLIPAIPIAF